MAGDDSEGFGRAIVHGQPASRDVEGRRLLEAVRAKMFASKANTTPVEIGPYRVLRRIGQGGMGVVYEAHDPKRDRRVALKLVRTGPGVRRDRPARLIREAQALSMLSHPNVVPVYEAGRHEGQVYLAMEYIAGQTLDRWQAQLRPWPEVVHHYVAAGRGLAAAHEAGLVHRDFKPANVMLADDGRVLVMDFGLVAGQSAQLDEPAESSYDIESVVGRLEQARGPDAQDPAGWEALTRTGQIVGTYSYMPPEQQEGKAAEALADQFAFCTAFLEGLQGEFPFVGDSVDELYESKRVGTFVEDPPRAGIPRALRQVLLRGLRSHPSQRWPDMEALLREVERSVRRRGPAAAGAAALVVCGGVVAWSLLSTPAPCEEAEPLAADYGSSRRSAIEAALLRSDFEFARPTSQHVLETLDAYAEVWARQYAEACQSAPGPASMRAATQQCLEHRRFALAAVAELLATAQPRLTADAVALASGLPRVQRCGDELYLAAAVRWPSEEESRSQVNRVRRQLASVRVLTATGSPAQARLILEPLVDDPDTAHLPALRSEAELALGALQQVEGDGARAAQTLERAYARANEAGHFEVAAQASVLLVGVHAGQLGQTAKARAWAQHAQEAFGQLGKDPLDMAKLAQVRGRVLLQEGRYSEAHAAFDRVLETLRARLRHEHPDLVSALHDRGRTFEAQQRWQSAVQAHSEAVELAGRLFTEGHPQHARSLVQRARAQHGGGDFAATVSALRQALQVQRAVLGDDHVDVAVARSLLSRALDQTGEFEQSAQIRRQALASLEMLAGRDHISVAVALVDLAGTLNRLDRWLGAATALDRAQAIFDAQLAADHPQRRRLDLERARTQQGQGDLDAARRTLESSVDACDRSSDAGETCTALRALIAESAPPSDSQ